MENRFDKEAVTVREMYELREELKECVRENQIKDLILEVASFKKKIIHFVERKEMDKLHIVMTKRI